MAAGVDPTGQMEKESARETTNSKVEISKARVLILLIVLVVSMTKGVPVSQDVLQLLIGV
jgi:hypothetical protein